MAGSSLLSDSFSPLQKRLIASALGIIALAVILGFVFAILLTLRAFVTVFSGVLWPLAAAGILALILRPVVKTIHERTRLGRVQSIVLIYCLALLLLGVVIALVTPVLLEQGLRFLDRLPAIIQNLRDTISGNFPVVHDFLIQHLGEARLEEYGRVVVDQARNLIAMLVPGAQDLFSQLSNLFSIIAGLAIVPVYLFFFLKTERDPAQDLREQFSFVRDDWRDDAIFLAQEFAASMEAFFRGQILIGLIMGVLMAIGFTVVGVNFGIGLGLMIGALNIIPYFGTIIGLITVVPIAYLQPDGGPVTAGFALGVFVVVQLVESYFLTPKIMGEKTGLHPLVIIVAIFFWGTALGGLLGMILAIPLTAFFVVAWRLIKRKYLEPLKASTAPAATI